MSRSAIKKVNVEENIRTMKKNLFYRGLMINLEGGPIWKKILHTYEAKVPES